MTHLPGRKRGRVLSRAVTAAIAATLIGTAAGTASAAPATDPTAAKVAESGAPQAAPRATAFSPSASAPSFPLRAVDDIGWVWEYEPNGRGNFKDREWYGWDWDGVSAAVPVDKDQDGRPDGDYLRGYDGKLLFFPAGNKAKQEIGPGWNTYDRIFSPGDLGGADGADVLARDKSGVLWRYKVRSDNTLTDRVRVGGGWDQFTDIAGLGDLNGDGKPDIVAKDRQGVLWFYKGNGSTKDPFDNRVKVGQGWNTYNTLIATGDVDRDGQSDLLARDRDGVMWLYKGNGNQRDPFENRTRIGGGWDQYRLMF
ncbi:FG-GAP repeat domain-containing protein [Streptomyces sp. NPDC001404]|uniref:FG-GAP repeat domain-containing protein n=1 Tax=Streptomyces sp. NPDC001404 TaxID=3364571 RepID=UPI0036BC5596